MALISSPFLSIAVPFSLLVQNIGATYLLDTNIAGASFFGNWNFQTSTDPSHGFVQYLSQPAAQNAGLIFAQDGTRVRISADSKTTLSSSSSGRKSLRLQSKNSWTHGLFIHDIAAMPAPACGIWPALWLLGPNWPSNGEIDIVEGVNYQSRNTMTLHTSAGCTFAPQNQLGTLNSGQCYGAENNNAGCGFTASSTATYGSGFNANGGGVYATEWTKDWIKIWEFRRGEIPQDIISGRPMPGSNGWGAPQAFFRGGNNCNIDSHFRSMSLVLNIDFCGDWAGNVWSTDANCRGKATNCRTYVANNPGAFTGTQFLINSIKVYKNNAANKRSDDIPLVAHGRMPLEVSDFEAEASILNETGTKVTRLAPESLEKEAAYDAYMLGDEQPLLAILEAETMMEEVTKIKEELGVTERRLEHTRGHGHTHAQRYLHRNTRNST